MDAAKHRALHDTSPQTFFRNLSPAARVGLVLFLIALSLTIIGLGIESADREYAPTVRSEPRWVASNTTSFDVVQKASLAT